ncbi:hypothetical protein [Micromonospora qiuiae]|uniref:hypothetical protein n=1 Tax=Micromonospora qiuiae TaxID=502268 RepID=UPI00194E64C1|nr:hypothetical protein [Micromonospora qiuiae]
MASRHPRPTARARRRVPAAALRRPSSVDPDVTVRGRLATVGPSAPPVAAVVRPH